MYRLGTRLINMHLVEDGGRFTLVDTGLPGYFGDLIAALDALGADVHDIDAVVLTHAHADHFGLAERLRTEAQARVHVHQADAQAVRTATTAPREGSLRSHLWRPTTLRLVAHTARNGRRAQRVADVTTFSDATVLDVPGHPRTIHTPGHSHGHTSLLFEGHGVLVAGDALCSRDPLTGRTGPQIMPAAVNSSTDQALRSLARLEEVDAPVVVFGHGDPWMRGAAEAVAQARTRATEPE